METRNLNNPGMLSDIIGKPSIKGAFATVSAGLKIKIKPYLSYLPDGVIIGRNKSTEVNVSADQGGNATAVTVAGMERWVTVVMFLNNLGTLMDFKVIAGSQAINTEVIRPTRGSHNAFTEYDVIVADVRLYYGMVEIRAEDIDLSRAETANFLDTSLIPIEVYGPPLNEYKNLDEVIQGINSGALDYRYIKKDAAEFIKFELIDISVCTNTQTPKGDGYFYYVYDGTNKFLAINMGCSTCQAACETCNVGCEASCDNLTQCPVCQAACEALAEVHPPYYGVNEGIKRVVLTDPPAGFCATVCDVTCETPAVDTIACVAPGGGAMTAPCLTCEAYCEANCQIGCQIVCDAIDAAAICGSNCQATCEIACQATCMSYCQVGCEISCQIPTEYPCGNVCEVSCQSGYQVS